jgi:uncharacterized protein with HEPN domain
MRPEKLYLTDIVEAADAIQRFCQSRKYEDFLYDEMCQSAVLQKLIIIGEATARLSAEFQAAHAGLDWSDIVGFRNFAVHEYFAVKWDIVWVTATQDVPALRQQIARLLTDEFSEPGDD